MDSAELDLFRRSVGHATSSHSGAALDAALTELGWHDALSLDARAAVPILFELQGAANTRSSALGDVILDALGLQVAGVVLPALGRWHPPGELDGGRLQVRGLGTAMLGDRETAVVVARTGDDLVMGVAATAELTLRPVHGVDPWLGLVEVTGDTVLTDSEAADWRTAVTLAQLAIGHELVGAARTMLGLAREHALERIQFGRPISEFQAVRHRLADTLVAIETADTVLAAAWEDRSPKTAAMAKALAGRGARTAARHCQQVLAGIGFTTEHALHRYVRRTLVLDELFGPARSLTLALGTELLRTRRLPALLPL